MSEEKEKHFWFPAPPSEPERRPREREPIMGKIGPDPAEHIMQTSFAAGELSPTLFGRVDFSKYHVGLAEATNVFVDYRGGVSNRPGTRYVGYTAAPARLIPFSYSNLQNYILVFADHSMRVVRNGGLVLEPAKTIVGRAGNLYTVVAHGYSVGENVNLTDQTQPSTVNSVGDADHFTLVNTITGLSTISASATVARIFTLVTPWAAQDLPLLKFTQSFDTMTLVHPNYTPYDLTRTQHWVWILTAITFSSKVPPPTMTAIGITVAPPPAAGSSTTDGYGYAVTAQIDTDESVSSAAITFQGYNISVTPGTIYMTWTPILGATKYNVYRTTITPGRAVDVGAPYGYIGKSNTVTFQDGNIVPDFTKVPPTHTNPFAGGNYPSCACYFEQRKVFAASNGSPQTIWMSQPGLFQNMDVSDPVNDGDALNLTISSTKANNIKSMQPMPGGLVVLTSEGAWQISGSAQFSAVKPTDVQGRPQSHNGANDMPPIPINYEILYVQSKGSIVRSMAYQIYSNNYQTSDLTILSNHLFSPHVLVEWAYSEEPHKIIWCVREDGKLLSLTYMKDQEIVGWTKHVTYGDFKSVAVIQEGQLDTAYFIVRRGNNTFIEQMQPRDFGNLEEGWFLDCALNVGLVFPNSDADMIGVSGLVVLLANAGTFSAGDLGKVVRFGGGIGTVQNYVNTFTVQVLLDMPVTDVYYSGNVPLPRHQVTGTWSMSPKVTTVTQLNHLEGQAVSVLADGNVVTGLTVSGGSITLPTPASYIIVGYNFYSRIESLYLEGAQKSIQGKRSRVQAASIQIHKSRGLKLGQVDHDLVSIPEPVETVLTPQSGYQRVGLDTTYVTGAQICVEQNNPWPMSVLMLIPEVNVGDE